MNEEREDATGGQLDEIKQLIRSRQKIAAIKLLREQTGRGLKESKELVEQIEQKMVADGELDKAGATGCSGVILLAAASLGSGAYWWLG